MKKLTALILILMLTVPAALAASPAEVVGSWYVSAITGNSGFGTGTPLADYHLELNRDKSASLFMNGVERPYTWDVTDEGLKIKTVSEGPEGLTNYFVKDFVLTADGTLTAESVYDYGVENGSFKDIVLVREEPDKLLPVTRPAESEDEFFGDWKAFRVVQNNVAYDFADAEIEIEFAQATFKDPVNDAEVELLTDYKDAMLTAEGAAIDRHADAVRCEMTDVNGVIVATLTSKGAEVYRVYFIKEDAAEAVEEALEEAEEAAEEALEGAEEAVEEAAEEAAKAVEEAIEEAEEAVEEGAENSSSALESAINAALEAVESAANAG